MPHVRWASSEMQKKHFSVSDSFHSEIYKATRLICEFKFKLLCAN